MHDTSTSSAGAVVVVGIDGSDTSWDALCWACGETSRLGGRTVAVFVGPTSAATTAAASFGGAAVAYGAIQQTMVDRPRGWATRFAATRLTTVSSSHSSTLMGHGHGLLRIASSDHADLIVVGRSTKARHHLAGSLGRRLVGRRNAPIVVVVP